MSDATMGELTGRVALVTGGSRGIGLSIGEELARAGARVALVARDGDRAAQAAASLPGSGHIGLACDVGDGASVQEALRRVEESVGEVDILVNNAGITRDGLLMRMKEEDWDDVMRTNLKGAFHFAKAVSRGMMKRRSGVILNISSVIGLMGNAGQANYAASKAGLIGFTQSLAKELGSRGIRVNAIAPGFIETDMTDALSEDQVAKLRDGIPMGRLGAPEDVAHAVRFLAGPGAGYITGQVLTVDGGMVM